MSVNDPKVAEAVKVLRTGAQRQDSASDQLEDVLTLARAAGCYDALDCIKRALGN
jgi:hypothetical protein